MPRAVAMATIRPASADRAARDARPDRPAATRRARGRAGRSRRRRPKAGRRPAARRSTAARRRVAARWPAARPARATIKARASRTTSTAKIVRQPARSAKSAVASPAKRDAGGHEGAPQRQGEGWWRGAAMAAISDGHGDDDQQIADARQAARGEQHGGTVGGRAQRRRRRHDQDADAERPAVTDPLAPAAGRQAEHAPTRVTIDTVMPAVASDRPRSRCSAGTSGGTMPSWPAASDADGVEESRSVPTMSSCRRH